jgi:ABC-type uncharacterized transport system ATPase subunit
VHSAKKIKLLTTKIMEMSKTSQNIKVLRASNSVDTKSLSPSNNQERSKKLMAKQHGSSYSIGSAT